MVLNIFKIYFYLSLDNTLKILNRLNMKLPEKYVGNKFK